MATTPDESITLEVRNQVLLERLKEDEHEKFAKWLRRMDRQLLRRLKKDALTPLNKSRLNALVADTNRIVGAITGDYMTKDLAPSLEAIAAQQAAFEGAALSAVAPTFEAVVPAAQQLVTAFRVQPLSVTGMTGSPLLEPFVKNWGEQSKARVSSVLRQGFAQGKTVGEMTREIRGTRGRRFQDGRLAEINRANRSIVRTGIQHVASVARQETMEANPDIVKRYRWVSTLDGKTTATCRGLDGRIFEFGKGPVPPIHINCRSTTAPVLDERFSLLEEGSTRASRGASGGKQVSADETYYSWLKKQPAGFQDAAIGPTRGKLLRNGGIDAERFAELSLNRNFEPMTLDEMRAASPEVFERAGI